MQIDRLGNPLQWRWHLLALLISVYAIFCTKNFGMFDSGDFVRSILFMLEKPVGVSDYKIQQPWWYPYWEFKDGIFSQFFSEMRSTAAWQYYILGITQKMFETQYSLRIAGCITKAALSFLIYLISLNLAKNFNLKQGWAVIFFGLFTLTIFAEHNSAFINSFYDEQTFIIALPLLVFGLTRRTGQNLAVILISVLLAAGAKNQYFYLPTLFAIVYAYLMAISRQTPRKTLIVLLGATQLFVVCLMITKSDYKVGRPINNYNSLYFGSYVAEKIHHVDTTPVVTPECVGTDAWGYRYDPFTREYSRGPAGCFDKVGKLSTADALRPYVNNPALLVHILGFPLSQHLTVHYYHVDPKLLFRVRAKDLYDQPARNNLFSFVTLIRERYISPNFLPLIALGLCFAVIPIFYRKHIELQLAILFLAAIGLTQLYVSIIGEGYRDLSKHLSGAQFSLDLMLVTMIIFASSITRAVIKSRRGINARVDFSSAEDTREEAPGRASDHKCFRDRASTVGCVQRNWWSTT